jgi:hypothetical protein
MNLEKTVLVLSEDSDILDQMGICYNNRILASEGKDRSKYEIISRYLSLARYHMIMLNNDLNERLKS